MRLGVKKDQPFPRKPLPQVGGGKEEPMKNYIPLMLCLLLLAACTPQQQPAASQTAAAPAESTADISQPEEPGSSSEATASQEPQSPEENLEASSESSSKEENTVPEGISQEEREETPELSPPRQVPGELTVFYDGGTPRFSMQLQVPSQDIYSGSADTVTVERQRNGRWEQVRGENTGNFTLEGKLAVNGPLPRQILDDAPEGIPYRVTILLQTGSGGQITASGIFHAGETFSGTVPEKTLASPETLQITTEVTVSEEGLLPFTQTITNTSGQTITLEGAYQVLQSRGGVWQEAAYPGTVPNMAAGGPILLPGQSVTDSGLLPVTAAQARRGGDYRIVRRAIVACPREDQEAGIEFYTELTAGESFQEAAPAQETPDNPELHQIPLILEQTGFLAGEIPLAAWIENTTEKTVTASALRIYRVSDGETLWTDESEKKTDISPKNNGLLLDTALELEAGEYMAEVSLRSGDAAGTVSKGFTVYQDKLENAASAATVEMKISVQGEDENGMAVFTQTFTNHSCQTLLVGRSFQTEQPGGGLWTPVGDAKATAGQEDLLPLHPGASVTLEGTLPFPAKRMPDQYRITRTIMVENPLPSQKNGLTLVYTVTKK